MSTIPCPECGVPIRLSLWHSGRLLCAHDERVEEMKERATLQTSPMIGAPQDVFCFVEARGHVWFPMHFPLATELCGNGEAPHFEYPELKVELLESRGQPLAVDTMASELEAHRGSILQAFTGSGKTIMGYAVGAKLKTRIGVIVYAEHMVEAFLTTAKQVFGYGPEDVGIVQGERCDLDKPITIMMAQSLYSSRTYPDALYRQFGVLILDEIHRFGSPVWQSVLQLFTARYRLGMSATPQRKDDLMPVVYWNIGVVGHIIRKTEAQEKPSIYLTRYNVEYQENDYFDRFGEPDSMKYDKLLANDKNRNIMIAEMIRSARRADRKIIVFARLRDHLAAILMEYSKLTSVPTKSALFVSSTLVANSKKKKPLSEATTLADVAKSCAAGVEEALAADVVFTTFGMASAAFNKPDLDTLIFASPIGDVTQPLGRLRDKGSPGRRPLMAVDVYEQGPYCEKKLGWREGTYRRLGCKVFRVEKPGRPYVAQVPVVKKKRKRKVVRRRSK